jgi:serine/threonine protein phosphatase PrpC
LQQHGRSGGLTQGLFGDHLVEFLRDEQSKNNNPAHRLVDEFVLRDGRDNVTALVIEAI